METQNTEEGKMKDLEARMQEGGVEAILREAGRFNIEGRYDYKVTGPSVSRTIKLIREHAEKYSHTEKDGSLLYDPLRIPMIEMSEKMRKRLRKMHSREWVRVKRNKECSDGAGILTGIPGALVLGLAGTIVAYSLGSEYSTQIAEYLNSASHLYAPISGAVQLIGSLGSAIIGGGLGAIVGASPGGIVKAATTNEELNENLEMCDRISQLAERLEHATLQSK